MHDTAAGCWREKGEYHFLFGQTYGICLHTITLADLHWSGSASPTVNFRVGQSTQHGLVVD